MLDKRLMACADYVRPGARMCDVGTDHAYLPCYLAKAGKIRSAIASDVHEKPLESAARTIREQGVEQVVQLRLSDGLEQLRPEEAEDIVMAGMGGELIARIIACCSWLKDGEKRLILQPMTQVSQLRRQLCQMGFEILSETPVLEGGHHYTVLCCSYSGVCCTPDELFCLLGRVPEYGGQQAREYLQYQRQRLLLRAEGLRRAKADRSQEAAHWEALAEEVDRVCAN